jgi:hypothetical protein
MSFIIADVDLRVFLNIFFAKLKPENIITP